jgi:hypothetical protein
MTVALGLALGLTAQTRADFIALDPTATYLHTSANDPAPAATIVDLSTLSFTVLPGSFLQIQQVGDFEFSTGAPDTAQFTGAVFSSTNTLLPNSAADRVPDAIAPAFVSPGIAFPFVTANSMSGNEPTDIPDDFAVARGGLGFTGVTVEVPTGARFLFISAIDVFFSDNRDPNHDYGVTIDPAPEPASITLLTSGLLAAGGFGLYRQRRGASQPTPGC